MTDLENLTSQRYADDKSFFDWWKQLIELTSTIQRCGFVDIYYIRAFFVHLYELMVSGRIYVQYAKSWGWSVQDARYEQFDRLCKMITEEITENEFFMINYYRNCACHIHLIKYSWLNKNYEFRKNEETKVFHKLDGSEYRLTQNEVMEIAKTVIGKYGFGEDRFKRELFNRLSPFILKENPFLD